ncbi:UTP--glucose-1-phosphate uridylyltransferase [bacterium]|nr:UTP--glucose-1-phosphate uridylyltransferase [bacterium]
MKITKAIIPAAGLGTRLLPATKAIPKEMLPIINVPAIQLIVEEAVKSGIKDILIVVSQTKNPIIDHFDYNYELQQRLIKKNKKELAMMIKKIGDIANIQFIRQKEPLGLGHAIKCGKIFCGNDPFAVILGDDVVKNLPNEKPALRQCIETFLKTNSCVVGIQKIKKELVNKYGIVIPKDKKKEVEKIFTLKGLIEKPSITKTISNYAILGRYVLTNDIFEALEKTKVDQSGEIQLTNALKILIKKGKKVSACQFTGKRYDLGSKIGFVSATIDYALEDPEIKNDIIKLIKDKVDK